MRVPILKAVAAPPRLLWAPFVIALANLGVQFPVMFMFLGLGDFNPLVFCFSIVIVHFFIIFWGTKEPHISTMTNAFGPMSRPSKNLYKCRGNKFAP
ncbi:MAG: hypothetical protein AB7U85_07040 [Alphaproteobacteria bacterium]